MNQEVDIHEVIQDMGDFHKWGYPKMDDWGVPLFQDSTDPEDQPNSSQPSPLERFQSSPSACSKGLFSALGAVELGTPLSIGMPPEAG